MSYHDIIPSALLYVERSGENSGRTCVCINVLQSDRLQASRDCASAGMGEEGPSMSKDTLGFHALVLTGSQSNGTIPYNGHLSHISTLSALQTPHTPPHTGRIPIFHLRPLRTHFQPHADHLPKFLPCLPADIQILSLDMQNDPQVFAQVNVAL